MHTEMESPQNAVGRRTENVVSRNRRTVTIELARRDVDARLYHPRDELDEMLRGIASQPEHPDTNYYLRMCGMTAPAAPPRVSVPGLILALGRFVSPLRIKPACWKRSGPHTVSNAD